MVVVSSSGHGGCSSMEEVVGLTPGNFKTSIRRTRGKKFSFFRSGRGERDREKLRRGSGPCSISGFSGSVIVISIRHTREKVERLQSGHEKRMRQKVT